MLLAGQRSVMSLWLTITLVLTSLPLFAAQDNSTSCSPDFSLQLANGTETRGRLEICYLGDWGTVCDDIWSEQNAQVACRQLGLSGGIPLRLDDVVDGSGPIFLDDVNCVGNESRLIDCPSRQFTSHNCAHHEDAGVECEGPALTVSIIPSKPLSVLLGDYITLDCSAVPTNQQFNYTWTHLNSSTTLEETSNILTLPHISLEQLGTYRCSVTSFTSPASDAQVTITSARPVIQAGQFPARTSSQCPSEDILELVRVDVLQLLSSQFDVRPLGLIRSYPAESCDQVLLANPASPSGVYWINSGQDTVQMYCQF